MTKKIILMIFATLIAFSCAAFAESLDGAPYKPGVDPNIDMYMNSYLNTMPKHSHGNLIERDILTKGDPIKPTRKGAVLSFVNRYTQATLETGATTMPTTLKGEQEIFYVTSGVGKITAGGKTAELHDGVAVLMPANLEFTITNTCNKNALTMLLINEPTPSGFKPNKDMLVKDSSTMPVSSTGGHWVHIVKTLFEPPDGLATLERVLTVSFDPMVVGQPHSHEAGVEEVWTQIEGESIAFIGKEIRMQPVGTAYMVPPDGKTPHSNINDGKTQVKMFYFARYKDHEINK